MNGCRNAMGWASHECFASTSKMRSERSQAAQSLVRSIHWCFTVSIMGVLLVTRGVSLAGNRPVSYQVDVYTEERTRQSRLENDVRRGLTATRKSLPPKYFYDRTGSKLFEQITALPEYYPTRTEAALLGRIAPNLTGRFFHGDIVEIGAGSSGKTRLVLDALNGNRRAVRYVPLDVDRLTLEASAIRLLAEYPGLNVHVVVGDFEE